MRTEAAALIGTIEAAVVAVLTVVAIQFEWDTELTAAMIGAGSAITVAIGTILIRANVWSQASHEEVVDQALRSPSPEA